MEHVPPPPAEELALLDRELAQLDARRAHLLTRRAWLVGVLRAQAPSAPHWGPPAGRPPGQPWGLPPQPKAPSAPRSAQNVLLTLGGLLLTVAAVAFTLVSWGSMGIAGRSAVLALVTVAALAAPAVLLRRKLAATAEALAALALVLTLLDAYAVHAVAAPETDGLAFTAGASAVLAALWAAYGLALGKLHLPLPAAVVLVQWPLLLGAWAAGAPAIVVGWALLATAVLDGAVALWGKGLGVRVTAGIGLAVMGSAALLVGLAESMTADGPLQAVLPGALLLTAAVAALAGARHAPNGFAQVGGAVAGLAAVAAVGGVLRSAVPGTWQVPAYLLCGLALLYVVRVRLPQGAGRGVLLAAGAVVAGALVWALPPVAAVVLGPVTLVAEVWTGAPEGFRGALGESMAWSRLAGAPVVLAVVAGGLAAAYRWWPSLVRTAAPLLSPGVRVRGAAGAGALVLGWGTLLLAAATLGVPYPAALALETALVAGLLAVAVRGVGVGSGSGSGSAESAGEGTGGSGTAGNVGNVGGPGTAGAAWAGGSAGTAGAGGSTWAGGGRGSSVGAGVGGGGWSAVTVSALVVAVGGAVSVGLLSLATEAATYAVFGALLVLFAGAALQSRAVVAQAVFAVAAVVWGTALTGCAAASLGLAPHEAAPLLLVVPALTVALGARLRLHPVALPVELAGALGALVAVGLAVREAPFLALVLALCGVLAAGAAVRPERRPVAGYVAAVLFVAATWVRLAASEVSAPEAYTLPVTVPALVIGVLRRRKDPEASSWTAYGPGLAATLLPSLAVAWTDPDWLRPLLLGVAALVITLLGAKYRLQALLLLGGAVLALDTLHELAPYVVQVAGALPRWLPPALAGLLLLAVGATYEQRLRDARRLKDIVGRMR
ncbi:SCO7613 C-terminal domain-containing membrane protein [Streptomyces sp. NPDC059452]|uniref:SCO7613 C-terminal domain-containing membrane protein n=1 Tax=Streptomyces sp. NPDC059452 TaxID=3346835 RepID=UPI0036B83D5E